ncbi:tRNA 2-selenouridine(34) synthase MnmH [Microbulbifer hydrolyticus]|uniref:tRNA 2-selenouridine synthase n=1 Tax=Microbulbifer hydrolyticus TaxID=48074 RepID=A0A6P1T8Z7_9GAMM|nr:tRNA 2-selenouridine(34) synthase MnmH [Microbulbifer hydrolyticus]MBB5213230.1 tRNA 2-selenouridine synthase [Microbulbifer hydrolyticus]QHQ38507.1 tRNA 2-selenouridine(34) synthase MnmH [Microbulbifer hydrolyticus]
MSKNEVRPDSADFREIFLHDLPLIDTRAPVEFSKGSFPNAVNLPLMTDSERQKVGTCYKQKGQQAAIALGHELVGGKVKEARVKAWATFAEAHPEGYLFCFRGGLRSQISQQWLREAGVPYPRVTGGYKAMRSFLVEEIESAVRDCQFTLVGGMTGTGKTEVLMQLDNAVDLEGHANHRGSSFGKRATPQPPQIAFENALAIDFLKRRASGQSHFVLEDESRLIGRCSVPLPLHQGMRTYPLVWLDDTLEGRVERILKDYVIDLCADFVAVHGAEEGPQVFAGALRQNLANITKRLGGARYQELDAIMREALERQLADGTVDRHRDWIAALLGDYYDPMYKHQLEQKAGRIIFRGNQEEVVAYLRDLST